MRTIASTLLLTGLASLCLWAEPSRQLTRPALPTADALLRLGLKQRWNTYIPMDGKRDGIAFTQVMEGETDGQIGIQTRSGGTFWLNAETGGLAWQARLGRAYLAGQHPAGFNSKLVFVVSGLKLYCLDRFTGNSEWSIDLPHVLSTAPVADEEQLYLSTSDARFHVYILPLPQRVLAARLAGAKVGGVVAGGNTPYAALAASLRLPQQDNNLQLIGTISQPPLVLPFHMILATDMGSVLSYQKEVKSFYDTFNGNAAQSAPMGQAGTSFYTAQLDSNLYGFDVDAGRLVVNWRVTTGSKIMVQPMAIDRELYVVNLTGGLLSLNRISGETRWRQPQAVEFVAAGKKIIYARDEHGKLLLLDRTKGTIIDKLDTGDFAVGVANGVTDRIYLANHDGLVLCLQELGADQPTYPNRAIKAPPPPAEEKPVEKPVPQAPAPEKPKVDKPKVDKPMPEKPKKDDAKKADK